MENNGEKRPYLEYLMKAILVVSILYIFLQIYNAFEDFKKVMTTDDALHVCFHNGIYIGGDSDKQPAGFCDAVKRIIIQKANENESAGIGATDTNTERCAIILKGGHGNSFVINGKSYTDSDADENGCIKLNDGR